MKRSLALLGILLALAVSVSAQDWSKAYTDLVNRHVVQLSISKGGEFGLCTGSVVAPNEVLTAAHCTNDAESIMIGEQKAKVRGAVTSLDLALLEVWTGKTPIKLAAATPHQGTPVLSVGYTDYFLTRPDSTASHVMGTTEEWVKLDQNLQFGYSGGPTINLKGELIGVNVRTNFQRNIGYIVPVERVRVFLSMVATGIVDRPDKE